MPKSVQKDDPGRKIGADFALLRLRGSELQQRRGASGDRRDTWNTWLERNLREDFPENVRRGDTALRLLKPLNLSNPRILEIGCANGWFCARLARLGKVTGIDLADREIAKAKILYPYVTFVCGDFLTLESPDESFDVAISIDVIPYVDDQRLFVDRVAGFLNPRGYLLLICPNKFVWDRTRFERQLTGKVPVKWLYMRELKDLLRPRFACLWSGTIIPWIGNCGMLRIVNSYRVNSTLEKIISGNNITKLKEKIGLGASLVVLAQKRH